MKIYILLAGLIFAPFLTSATGYNYLPNDVYIKQQEEKAALEYRISSIEAGLQNSPTLSILNIDSRITQLKQEKQTEINYVTGLYAKNGISNQLPSAIDKINAKYDSQIDNLEQQKDEYNDAIAEDKKLKSEINALKEQIKKIEQNQITAPADTQASTDTVKVPSAVDMFDYLDSLPPNEAQENMNALEIHNPKLYQEVVYIIGLKYPYGKPGSAMYKWYQDNNKLPSVVQEEAPEVQNTPAQKTSPQIIKSVSPVETVPVVEKPTITSSSTTMSQNTQTFSEKEPTNLEKIDTEIVNAVPEKPSFIRRVFNFFVNLF